ncbi:RhoGAP domain-containing protein [Cavenderia fasciculata]|uniref:RhoGAP domain-containing protein n=1 Tax=Cavenderia fasciculata TaxID=261658 RepID=F4PZ56_CACFS|nr:RhoGAP domain-containing protein [Cavenderia fasciculata]EGG19085.1 RhoGAP domain-containing protein [Cavenderia fasciculata]|eukprot:XP_004366718.1 RhoGAP domain-containing protein [Cavenderia fasciculata]
MASFLCMTVLQSLPSYLKCLGRFVDEQVDQTREMSSEIDFKTQLADRLKKRSSCDTFEPPSSQSSIPTPQPVYKQSLSPSMGRAHPPPPPPTNTTTSNNHSASTSPNFISPPASPKIGGANNNVNSSNSIIPPRPPVPERKLGIPPNMNATGKSNSLGSLPNTPNSASSGGPRLSGPVHSTGNLPTFPQQQQQQTSQSTVPSPPPPRQQSVIFNAPPLININNTSNTSNTGRPLPPPRSDSVGPTTHKSPPMTRQLPPNPNPNVSNNNNNNNLPPPPPPASSSSVNITLPPPPPPAFMTQQLPPPPPPTISVQGHPQNMPPPPTFKTPISPIIAPSPPPVIPGQLLPPRSFKMSPQHARGGSLDSKQMAIVQGQMQRGQGQEASSSSSSPMPMGSLSLSGGMPPPPNLMAPPPPIKRNSTNGHPGGPVYNPDTDKTLSTMINNRLSTGLSPPIKAPYFDDRILTNNNKTAELEAKRQQEERERIERDQKKKDKKGEKEQKEKEKREKKEKEKKEKEQKKKDKSGSSSSGGAGKASTPSNTIFNNTLDQVMEIQRDRLHCDNDNIPLILKTLVESIISNDGYQTEGIFRVPGQTSEVMRFKSRINELDFSLDTNDVHVLAGLLKLWLRELTEPVIPMECYNDCIKSWNSKNASAQILNQLPQLNRDVIVYLLNFLKTLSSPIYSTKTKMDIDNIAMVFAPGLLRCPSTDSSVLMLNSQYEKDFIKNLIESQ